MTTEREWEIRTTIYADGRRVGTVDALGDSLDFALESVASNIQRREIDTLTRWGRKMLDSTGEAS